MTISLRFTSPQTKVLRSTPVTGVRGRTLTARLVVTSPTATLKLPKVKLTLVQGKTDALTFVAGPPDDQTRLTVVQQDGLVLLPSRTASCRTSPRSSTCATETRADGEKGMLSIAFAPDYETSGLFYADYDDLNGDVRVVEYLGAPR